MSEQKYTTKHGLLARLFEFILVRRFRRINQTVEWHQHKSVWKALLNLIALRVRTSAHNLHDTDGDLTQPKPSCPFHSMPEGKMMRTESGTQNDLRFPAMGCRNSRLGRNVPRTMSAPGLDKLMKPNPLLISQKLLARMNSSPRLRSIFLPPRGFNFRCMTGSDMKTR